MAIPAERTCPEESELEAARSTLDVVNRDGGPIYVKVSKTLGEGQDGYFKIEGGQSERWKRHIGRRVTIVVSYFGDDTIEASVDHDMEVSSGGNKFEMNGGDFHQIYQS